LFFEKKAFGFKRALQVSRPFGDETGNFDMATFLKQLNGEFHVFFFKAIESFLTLA
jgi:hypothetical protein